MPKPLGIYGAPNTLPPPHPPFSDTLLYGIEAAFIESWRHLLTNPLPGFNLSTAGEEEVTAALASAFENVILRGRAVAVLSSWTILLSREGSIHSASGSSNKQPDLRIRIVRDQVRYPDNDGLFIECKPVDAGHTTWTCYCKDGLARFVNGRYAMMLTQAMMIGYSSAGYLLNVELLRTLRNAWAAEMELSANVTICPVSVATDVSQQVHISVHHRSTVFYDDVPAPDIVIRHLWLNRD
jgi:hypothetical protein